LNFTVSSDPVVLKLVPVMVTAVLKGPLVGLIAVMVGTGTGGGGGLVGGVLPFFEQAWAANNTIPKRAMAIDGFWSRIKRIFVGGNIQSPIYDPESSGAFAYVCETFGKRRIILKCLFKTVCL
jgi:hypothetical protein